MTKLIPKLSPVIKTIMMIPNGLSFVQVGNLSETLSVTIFHTRWVIPFSLVKHQAANQLWMLNIFMVQLVLELSSWQRLPFCAAYTSN